MTEARAESQSYYMDLHFFYPLLTDGPVVDYFLAFRFAHPLSILMYSQLWCKPTTSTSVNWPSVIWWVQTLQ